MDGLTPGEVQTSTLTRSVNKVVVDFFIMLTAAYFIFTLKKISTIHMDIQK